MSSACCMDTHMRKPADRREAFGSTGFSLCRGIVEDRRNGRQMAALKSKTPRLDRGVLLYKRKCTTS